jgi:hypothetical protein
MLCYDEEESCCLCLCLQECICALSLRHISIDIVMSTSLTAHTHIYILTKIITMYCTAQGSGCRVLLVNDMSEDLSRMFR